MALTQFGRGTTEGPGTTGPQPKPPGSAGRASSRWPRTRTRSARRAPHHRSTLRRGRFTGRRGTTGRGPPVFDTPRRVGARGGRAPSRTTPRPRPRRRPAIQTEVRTMDPGTASEPVPLEHRGSSGTVNQVAGSGSGAIDLLTATDRGRIVIAGDRNAASGVLVAASHRRRCGPCHPWPRPARPPTHRPVFAAASSVF